MNVKLFIAYNFLGGSERNSTDRYSERETVERGGGRGRRRRGVEEKKLSFYGYLNFQSKLAASGNVHQAGRERREG
jgi:hypothetical protein